MAAATALIALAQPMLADGIPVAIMPSTGQRVAGTVAAYLTRAKAVTRGDFPLPVSDPLAACAMVLSRWLNRHIGETSCLQPVFQLEPVAIEDISDIEEPSAEMGASDVERVRGIHISWSERNICHWTVGPGFDRLEAAVPNLGATVLDILERKSWQAYPLFTPTVVLDEASNQYWMGEADETEYLESECGDDREAWEATRADMVTRAEIEAAFPPWALQRKAEPLPRQILRELSRNHADDYVRRAASLALALANTRTHADFTARREGLFTGFCAVLCWRDEDIAVRVSDDYAQYAWQGESFEEIGEVILPMADPGAFRLWMRAVEPNLRAIGLIDQLLLHLAEGY
ncbi:MAG: PRTRC system protein F [Pseudomonadota bacterium]